MVKGLSVEIIPEVINTITTLPLGLPWRKEDKGNNTFAKKRFFLEGEEPIEDKNLVIRGPIPYPWNEFIYHLIKYISCEGIYSVVYGYHFILLQELRFGENIPPHNKLSIPYSFLQSMIGLRIKVQEGKHQKLAQHVLIKLILEDVLQNLRFLIAWTTFIDMQAEGEIKAIEYHRSPTTSEGEEETKEEKEEETEEENEEEIEEETKEETYEKGEEIVEEK